MVISLYLSIILLHLIWVICDIGDLCNYNLPDTRGISHRQPRRRLNRNRPGHASRQCCVTFKRLGTAKSRPRAPNTIRQRIIWGRIYWVTQCGSRDFISGTGHTRKGGTYALETETILDRFPIVILLDYVEQCAAAGGSQGGGGAIPVTGRVAVLVATDVWRVEI